MTRRFTPYDRPRRRFPIAVVGLWAAVAGLSWLGLRPHSRPLLDLALLPGLIAGGWLGAWAEQRWYLSLVGKRPGVRILGAASAIALSAALTLAMIALTTHVLTHHPGSGAAIPGAFATFLWLGSAACGTLVVLLLDVLVSAIARGFRQRLMLAILGLQVLMVVPPLLATARLWPQFGDLPEELVTADPLLAALKQNPATQVAVIAALYLLLSLPAILSLAGKTADSAMDRIHPLRRALDALAKGERDVELEEGGAEDFVVVSRAFNGLVGALAKAEKMERAFGLYAGGMLLDKIRSQHGEATLVAEGREATVFFADIRGFSAMSERLAAPEILSLLNRWFERVVAVVAEHEGYLNKFIGDAVVVVFNGPVDQPDHAARAVHCARALQAEASRMNAAGHFPEIGRLEIGIGIATGPMICGNVGASERQMEYTVIGDTVNLASRLTGRAAPGEIWMSDVTAAALPAELKAEPLDPVQVKGKEKPVVPWRLLAA